jgi:hypothetical protein
MGLCQLHQLRNRDFGSACAIGFWIESNPSKPKPVKICDEQQERVMIDEPHLSVAGLAWRHVVGYGRRLRKRERANAVFRRRRSAFNGHKNPKRKANWRDSAHSESTQAGGSADRPREKAPDEASVYSILRASSHSEHLATSECVQLSVQPEPHWIERRVFDIT